MYAALTGAGWLPAILLMCALAPIAYYDLGGRALQEDPRLTYRRIWRRLTRRR